MRMRHTGAVTAATLTLGLLLLARPSIAQEMSGDEDLDGVVDGSDSCPDTPEGDIVDVTGCSVCPCEGPTDTSSWSSRGAYLGCITNAVRAQKRGRSMNRKQAVAAMKAARKSSCGDENLTRCCIFPADDMSDTVIGKCRVVSVDQCDQLADQLDWAEDFDPGSCLPNPCVF